MSPLVTFVTQVGGLIMSQFSKALFLAGFASVTFFFHSTSLAAYEDQILVQESRKSLDFEFECTVHTSFKGEVYSPLIRLFKVKQPVEEQNLKDHLSQIFEREFSAVTIDDALQVFQEFEKNAATPACNQHRSEFLKLIKRSPDVTLWGHQYEYIGKRVWLQLLIYSESKKSILSYNINFR